MPLSTLRTETGPVPISVDIRKQEKPDMEDAQTASPDRSETIAFRTSTQIKRLVEAAAARHDVLASDWLRSAVERVLVTELGEGALGRPARDPGEVFKDGYRMKHLADEELGVTDA